MLTATRMKSVAVAASVLLLATASAFLLSANVQSSTNPTPSDPKASAAEELQQAIGAGKSYKGWVQTTVDSTGMTAPAGMPALPKRATYYTNTADGSHITVREYADGLEISASFVTQGETASFSYKTNEIRIGSLHVETAGLLQQNIMPVTLGDLLALAKKEDGRDPSSIKETPEGELKRFDMMLFPSEAEAEKYRKEQNRDLISNNLVVWVNHDNLMTRMKFADRTGPVTAEITYGPPEIHDIYDLGAPRTAKVIDERLKNDLKGLMARLDARALKGFGDYAALLASYDQDAIGKLSPDYGYVTLVAAKGDKWLANEYRLFDARRHGPEVVMTALPPNWPAPDLAKLLPTLFDGKPMAYTILDGDHGWGGGYQNGPEPFRNARIISAKERNILLGEMAGPGHIWPTSFRTGISFPEVTADVIQDKAHPGLIGLHYKSVPTVQNGPSSTGETTWWLNPARDDKPTEMSSTETEQGQDKPNVVLRTQYEEFAQLPNGQWYPVRWHEERINRNLRTGKDESSTSYYRLQIMPALKLEDKWFTDPRKRLNDAGRP